MSSNNISAPMNNARSTDCQGRMPGGLVECQVVYGSEQHILERLAESPSRTINTAYIERSNLDWRLWDAHLVRKAPTAARSMRWLKAKFAICVACYNLIRPHETLSVARIGFSVPRHQLWKPAWSIISGLLPNCWPIQRFVNEMVTSSIIECPPLFPFCTNVPHYVF